VLTSQVQKMQPRELSPGRLVRERDAGGIFVATNALKYHRDFWRTLTILEGLERFWIC